MIIDIDRPAIKNRVRKFEQCHIWPAPRAIDSKKPEARGWQAEQVAVAMRKKLICLFRGAVKGQRVINILSLMKGHILVQTVNRR